jgi:surface protein
LTENKRRFVIIIIIIIIRQKLVIYSHSYLCLSVFHSTINDKAAITMSTKQKQSKLVSRKAFSSQKKKFPSSRPTNTPTNDVRGKADLTSCDPISSNQPSPGAERIFASSIVDEDGLTVVVGDENDNGDSVEPPIIEATAVGPADEQSQLQRERERVRDERRTWEEDRQQYLRQLGSEVPLVHATTKDDRNHIIQGNGEAGPDKKWGVGLLACKRKWFLICILILVIVSISVGIALAYNPQPPPNPASTLDVGPKTQNTSNSTPVPTGDLTELSTSTYNPTPAPKLNDCQIQAGCQGITGIPVSSNENYLRNVIKDYLNNPSVSPYGSIINCWDVSQVTDMSFAFTSYFGTDDLFQNFDQPLNCWDVSSVTDMSYMFQDATSFNHDVGSWDVSHVTSMQYMFAGAASFNQDIESWDVSNVADMTRMFGEAESFNQNLCPWRETVDLSNVAVYYMFWGTSCEDTTTPTSIDSNWCQVCSV